MFSLPLPLCNGQIFAIFRMSGTSPFCKDKFIKIHNGKPPSTKFCRRLRNNQSMTHVAYRQQQYSVKETAGRHFFINVKYNIHLDHNCFPCVLYIRQFDFSGTNSALVTLTVNKILYILIYCPIFEQEAQGP